jgi:hypothetical protein
LVDFFRADTGPILLAGLVLILALAAAWFAARALVRQLRRPAAA